MLLLIDLFFKMPEKVVLSDEHFIKKWSETVISWIHSFLVFPLRSQGKVLNYITLISMSPYLVFYLLSHMHFARKCFNS